MYIVKITLYNIVVNVNLDVNTIMDLEFNVQSLNFSENYFFSSKTG